MDLEISGHIYMHINTVTVMEVKQQLNSVRTNHTVLGYYSKLCTYTVGLSEWCSLSYLIECWSENVNSPIHRTVDLSGQLYYSLSICESVGTCNQHKLWSESQYLINVNYDNTGVVKLQNKSSSLIKLLPTYIRAPCSHRAACM